MKVQRRRARRTGLAAAGAAALALASAGVLSAHDFLIVPNALTVGTDGWIEVRGQTSATFPTSLSAITAERVAEAKLMGASSEERIADPSVSGTSLLLKHHPTSPGQRVVAVALVTRTSRTAPSGLKRYVALEGAPELAERFEREGAFASSDSVTESDSGDVVATVGRFHAALAAGDSLGALALLTEDVIILESGGVETREEYRSHHLPGDITFARAVKSERGPLHVVVRGDVAWASGTSTTQGEYRGRQINSTGAELVVLTRTPQGWRIAALHWSSRARRAPGG